jgi:hypothetical protein
MEKLLVESDYDSLASRAWFAPHHRAGYLVEAGNKAVGGLAAKAGLKVAV